MAGKTTKKALNYTGRKAAPGASREPFGSHGRTRWRLAGSICCFVVALLATVVLAVPAGAAGVEVAEPEPTGVGGASGMETSGSSSSLPTVVIVLSNPGNNYAAQEGGRPAEVSVQVSPVQNNPLTVSFGPVAGTTAAPSDYRLLLGDVVLDGSITIPAGQYAAGFIVSAVSDSIHEPAETLVLGVSASDSYLVDTVYGSATVRLWDSSAPPVASISVGPAVTEGSPASFTVSLSSASGYEVSVPYSVVTGSTTAGSGDYSLPASPLVFAPGEVSKTFEMATFYDGVTEQQEQVTVQLGESPRRYSLSSSAGSATAVIRDNATPPVASISAGSAVTEGSPAEFTVSLSVPSSGTVSVPYSVVAGSGTTAGSSDYSLPAGPLVFAPGETSKTIIMTTVDDSADEPTEQVTVRLDPDSRYTVSSTAGSAAAQIADNDEPPSVSVAREGGLSVSEGNNASAFTFTLSAVSGRNLSVNYTVSGTAISGTDYTELPGSVDIPAGSISATVSLATIEDALEEGTETVVLALDMGTNYVLGASSSATKQIEDDDAPFASIARSGSDNVTEGESMNFTVSLSAVSVNTITVAYRAVSDTATADDYSLSPVDLVTFAPGETSKIIVMSTVDDPIDEPVFETVNVELLAGRLYTVNSSMDSAYVLIWDNEDLPLVSFSGGSVTEGSSVSLPVSLSRASQHTLSIPYYVVLDQTTADLSDYSLPAGPLVFAPGETSKTITVTAVDDTIDEPSETVTVKLTSNLNYSFSGQEPSAVVQILDNDVEPVVAVSSGSVTEGSSVSLSVSLSRASQHSLSIPYNVVLNQTTAGLSDYFLPSGTLVFTPGQTSKTIDLLAFHDGVVESPEKVVVQLGPGSGYSVSSPAGLAVVWINDNTDALAAPVVSIARSGPYGVVEGGSRSLTIGLSAVSSNAVIVGYGVLAGSTTAGSSDYSLSPSGSVTFAAGETTKTVIVTTVDDSINESAEIVVVGLSSGSSYTVSSSAGSAAINILDNDAMPVVSITDQSTVDVTEGQSRSFTVSLSAASEKTITVGYRVDSYLNGMSQRGLSLSDFSLSPTDSVTFAPGETSKTIILTATDDSIDEGIEHIRVGLMPGISYTRGRHHEFDAHIVDNDAVPVASVIGSSVHEGSTASFTVSLLPASSSVVQVPYSVVAGSTTASSLDYSLSPTGSVSFAPGQTVATVTMRTFTDSVTEPSEKVTVQLGTGSGYSVSSTAGLAVAWIHPSGIALSVPVVSINRLNSNDESQVRAVDEGSNMSFEVLLSAASEHTLSVPYNVVAGSTTAGSSDYSLPDGPLVFAPGETSKTITITAVDDSLDEPTEKVVVQLGSGSNYMVNTTAGSVVAWIEDNDAPPVVSLSGGSATEGSAVSFTVSLSAASGHTFAVPYSLVAGSTTAGSSDYSLPAGPLVFAPGETSKTITMTTVDDQADEPSETVVVQLDTSYGRAFYYVQSARVEQGSTVWAPHYLVSSTAGLATAWTHDNNTAPVVPVVSIRGGSVTEGATVSLLVSLSSASERTLLVPYSVVTGSATTAGSSDYSLPAGPLVFAPGETSKTIVVATVNDTLNEPAEKVTVQLDSGSHYSVSITNGSAVVQISDNDEVPTVSIARSDIYYAWEGESTTVTVSLSSASGRSLTVGYRQVDGPRATALPSDYTLTPASAVTFAPGETSKTITVAAVADNLDEPNETVIIGLSPGSFYTVSSTEGSVRIRLWDRN